MDKILVVKLNTAREETWRYTGRVLQREPGFILLEALFNRPDKPFHGIVMRERDRFVEAYFDSKWFNIFEIHDREDDTLKAWYCNVTYPAEFSESRVAYVDLALDLLVYPEGSCLTLDEDEFSALDLPEYDRNKALQALDELKVLFQTPGEFKIGQIGKI